MKIAFVSGVFFPQPGGAQVQTHNLANQLIENGKNVHCYVYTNPNIKNNKYKIFKINYFVTSFVYFFYFYLNINLNFLLKIYLKRILKKNFYDVWYFNFINFKSLLLINCLKELNQKIIVTFQGIDIQKEIKINYGYRLNKKYENLLKNTLSKIDIFLAISNNIVKDLKSLKIKSKKIILFPNSINLRKFKNIKNKNSIGIKFITVGRYAEKKKGYDLVAKIAKKLIDNKINFKWRLVGKNINNLKKNQFIKKNIKYFELIENIENVNETYFPNSKLIKLYKSSDIYLNLSRIESFGITFIESLASKVPIITFNTKGANEIVLENLNGKIIKSFKNEEYVKKIIYYYKNREKLNSLKSKAFNSVKKYDLKIASNKIIEVIKSL